MNTKLPTTESAKTTRNFKLFCTPKFLQTTLLSALFFLLLGVGESWGQVSSYVFSETTGAYTAITGGTQLVTTTAGATAYDTDGSYFSLPAGSQFVYNGVTITSVNMTADGALWLNPSASTTGNMDYSGTSSTATASGVICAMNMDLRSTTVASTVYERRWQDTGTEVVFQWKNASRYNQQATEYFSFQIRIDKTTKAVSVIYGNMNSVTTSTTYQPVVGLRGASNTDYNNRNLTSSVPDGTPNWGAPNGTAAGTANTNTVRFRNNCIPVSGLKFTWTPPACSAPTALLASSITTTSASLSWTAPASAPSNGYEYAVTSSATSPASGTENVGTSVTVSSLIAGTTYYLHVRSNCGGSGYSSWATPTSFTTPCNATTTPYTQNFESVTAGSIPACTQVVQAGTGNLWNTVSAPGNGFTNMTLKYLYNGTNAANTWYFVNGLNLTAGVTYILSYRYGTVSTATFFENLKVAYGTSATAAAMTTTLATHASVANGTATTNSVTFTPPTSGTYYIGFQCYSTANQNVLYLDDIAVVNQPTIATSGTINAFTSCINTASTAQNFTVTGADLTANLVITAPTGFQVATTNSDASFSSTVTLTPSSGTVASTTIYTRMAALATAPTAANVTCTSTGATTKNVAVSGSIMSVSASPALTGIICSTATSISGTGINGSSINVLRSGASIGSATVSGGVWSASVSGLVANDVITATQTESGKCESAASTSATVVTCSPPTLSSFTPSSGCTNGQIVITGTNLSTVTAVSVNGTAVSSFTINSPTQITATLASGTTSGTVSIVNPYGTATSSSNYSVYSIGWANTQYPLTGTICPSGSFDVYGQIYASGLTEAGGAGAGIVAQLGYSTSNTDPSTWTNWVNTSFNTQSGNNDEFKGTLSGMAAGTYYYAFRYSLGTGCSYTYGGTGGVWSNNSGTLTVNANHGITLSSAVATTTQSVCKNSGITTITYALSGGATGANVSGLPTGVSASVSGTTLTISGTPSVTGSFSYSISTTGNSCTIATASGSIAVADIINWANLQSPASGTICSSGTFNVYGQVYQPGVTEAAGQGSGITVQLGYSTSNSDPSTWTNWVATSFNVQSGNNDEYMGTLSGLTAGTYYYAFRYKLTASTACGYQYGAYNGGFWNGTSNVNGVLTVNGAPTITASPTGTQSVCVSGTASALSVSATGVGTLSYQWYSNSSAATAGATAVGTNSTSYTPSAATAGTLYYYCAVTNSCGTTNSGFTGAITVNAAPTGITTTASASNASVCSGGTTSLSMNLNKSGSVTLGAGANTNSAAANSPFYHGYGGVKTQYIVKASELSTLGLSAGNISSLSINITTLGTSVLNQFSISVGHTSQSAAVTNTAIISGLSQVYTNGAQTLISGLNTFSFSNPFSWDGSSNIVITFCYTNNNTGGTSSTVSIDNTSFVSALAIYADNVANASTCLIPAVSSGQTCMGTNSNTTTSKRPQFYFTGNTAPAPTAYSWSDGISAIGSTNPYIATVNSDTTYTGTATLSSGCSVSASTSVTALNAPVIVTQPVAALTKCVGQSASFTVVASGSSLSYQWKKDGVAISGATSATYTVAAVALTEAGSYTVDVSGCSTTVTSNAAVLTVNANPTAVASSSSPVCTNTTFTLTGTSDIGTTFAWTGPNSYSSTSQSPSISNPTTSASGTYTFTASANGCSTSGTVSVTVNQAPSEITITPASASICSGNSQSLVASGGLIVSTYNSSQNFDSLGTPSNWTFTPNTGMAITVNNSANAGGTANELVFDYTSTSTGTSVAVMPVFDASNLSNLSISFKSFLDNYSATTYPYSIKLQISTNNSTWSDAWIFTPSGTTAYFPTNENISLSGLNGSSTAYVRFAFIGNSFGIDFWYIDNIAITGTNSVAQTYTWSPSATLNTTSGASVSATPTTTTTYTVKATTAAGCESSNTVQVAVNPLPTATITAGSSTTFCSGGSVVLTASDGSSYVWKKDGNTIPGATAQTYTATTAGAYTVTVTNASNCSATSAATTVTVYTLPNMPTASNVSLCGTGSVTLTANNPGAGLSVNWYNAAQDTQLAASSLTYTTPNLSTTTSYYAETVNTSTGCVSTNRLEVQAIINVTNTFTGGVSGTGSDWFSAANWSCGSVPNATTNVVIQNAKIVNIDSGAALANTIVLEGTARVTVTSNDSMSVTNKVTVASGATFTVENDASLVQTDNVANEGNITVVKTTPSARLLKRNDAVLWSSPVVQNLQAISTGTPAAYFMQHDPQSNSWSAVSSPATADFTKGKGFLVRTPSTFPTTATQQWSVNFTGVPNNGDITLSAGNTGSTEKYLLVGNPYPSAISIAAFKAANPNITGVFYFYRKPNGVTSISAYGTLDADGNFASNDSNDQIGALAPGNVIPSGQGFFVAMKSDSNNGNVYFTNSMRVANDHGQINRLNSTTDKYKLIVKTTSTGNSQMIVSYKPESTLGFDLGLDAVAFTDGTTDISAISANENYRIQARGDYYQADIIPLRFKTALSGEHRISLTDAQGVFAADQMVIIKDNLTGVQHNLTANGDYVFTSATGTFTNRFEVIYQQAYYTALQANSCGATIANMNSLVYADLVNGATGYRFKVVNNTTSAVQTIDRPQHWFAFNMLSAYDYNTPYTISVQVQKDGVWTGYYGASCTVNSPNIASTGVMQINPSQCGMTLPTIGTVIATTPVAGATGYKFRITNTTAGAMGNNLVQEITRTNHWFTLAMLTRYNYGSSYAIEVAVKTTGGYTAYGNACTVYAPAVPTLASCGQTVATSTTLVRTTATNLATQYRFQVTRIATQETITFDTANYWFSFRVNVPGYAAGEQYGVRVAVMTAGAWSPYGDACDITAPIATARTTEEAAPSEANLFKPVAYPNPFASTFGISLATPSADVVHVMVYDLQGRLIEKQNVFVSQLDSLQIGTNYPSGDYLLVVAQGANIKSSHIHKD
jgi:hypothetical protein